MCLEQDCHEPWCEDPTHFPTSFVCSQRHFGIPHTRDCYVPLGSKPVLSRQDATLQEPSLAIRQKAKVWFKENYPQYTEDNKENVPPDSQDGKKVDSEHHVKKEERHNVDDNQHHRN